MGFNFSFCSHAARYLASRPIKLLRRGPAEEGVEPALHEVMSHRVRRLRLMGLWVPNFCAPVPASSQKREVMACPRGLRCRSSIHSRGRPPRPAGRLPRPVDTR